MLLRLDPDGIELPPPSEPDLAGAATINAMLGKLVRS
jgi:hypothetical protein